MQLSKSLILVSNSPRRKEILALAGFEFTVQVKSVNEDYPLELEPENIAEYLAHKKTSFYPELLTDNQLILGADTIVICNQQVLGKPSSHNEAKAMLKMLSGNVHRVVTGVSIRSKNFQKSFSDQTDVSFKTLTDNEIDTYINQYKPFDKAGSYGIQEPIGTFGIDKIVGSFYNVMGLPIHLVYKELEAFRIKT